MIIEYVLVAFHVALGKGTVVRDVRSTKASREHGEAGGGVLIRPEEGSSVEEEKVRARVDFLRSGWQGKEIWAE